MSVYPIVNVNKATKTEEYDGCGFVTDLKGNKVFISCKHNFKHSDKIDFFIEISKEVRIATGG